MMMLKHFLRLDKGVDILIRWGGVFSLLIAGLAYGVKHATWLANANWAEAILVAIGLSLITMLMVTTCLALFRLYKPLPTSAGSSIGPAPEAQRQSWAAALEEIKVSFAEAARNRELHSLSWDHDLAQIETKLGYLETANARIDAEISRCDKVWETR